MFHSDRTDVDRIAELEAIARKALDIASELYQMNDEVTLITGKRINELCQRFKDVT